MRIVLLLIALLAWPSPAAAQPAPEQRPTAEQRPKRLVLFSRPGPNFAKLSEMRAQALAHREIYLKLADEGDIVGSGLLEGEPVLGLTLFRQGVEEDRIRKLLSDDVIVKAGVIELEFRHWSIQMGALRNVAPAKAR